MSKPSIFVGDKFVNTNGDPYTVIDYRCSIRGVTIQFDNTGNTLVCSGKEVKKGAVKNPLAKSVYGIGCFGVGPYKAKVNNKFTPEYQLWIGMMTRVYNKGELVKHPTYEAVTVCDDWLNYQVFAEWCQTQTGFKVEESSGRRMALDKDLLVPNNKVYSPDTCCFLPNQINVAMKGRQRDKQTELPSGVYWHNASNGYAVSINKDSKQYHLGCFKDVESARKVFRTAKKEYLEELSHRYKDVIAECAFKALLEINLDERTCFEYCS